MSGVAPGIRLATAATTLAIAPFTAVDAVDSLDGSFGFGSRRIDRAAAERAAFFFRAVAVLVFGVARLAALFFAAFGARFFAADRVFAGARLSVAVRLLVPVRFAGLLFRTRLVVRVFATPPPEWHH